MKLEKLIEQGECLGKIPNLNSSINIDELNSRFEKIIGYLVSLDEAHEITHEEFLEFSQQAMFKHFDVIQKCAQAELGISSKEASLAMGLVLKSLAENPEKLQKMIKE